MMIIIKHWIKRIWLHGETEKWIGVREELKDSLQKNANNVAGINVDGISVEGIIEF